MTTDFINEDCEPTYTYTTSIDHDKEIPADKRTGSGAYSMAMLCKQDKEQMDRIEAKLDRVLAVVDYKIW